MRGPIPKPANVIPMRAGADADADQREAMVARAIAKLQPKGLDAETRAEWKRVARVLADPTVDRLKPRFVDVIMRYCIACVRLRRLSDRIGSDVTKDVYRVEGRNGAQLKTNPLLHQHQVAWNQWRTLTAMLGLSPADEVRLVPGQGDLFDEAEQYFSG